MTIRSDNSIEVVLNNLELFNSKADISNFLLKQWISEIGATKYRYFVETLADGKRIYLERPGRLNKGCDFVIYLENIYQWQNGNDRPPNYKFILNDLAVKRNELSQNEWQIFLDAVADIYECKTIQIAVNKTNQLPFSQGYSYELLLKTIRWFLIEQDITYWSGQGRARFFNAIHNL